MGGRAFLQNEQSTATNCPVVRGRAPIERGGWGRLECGMTAPMGRPIAAAVYGNE
jgi:hypothetical protein